MSNTIFSGTYLYARLASFDHTTQLLACAPKMREQNRVARKARRSRAASSLHALPQCIVRILNRVSATQRDQRATFYTRQQKKTYNNTGACAIGEYVWYAYVFLSKATEIQWNWCCMFVCDSVLPSHWIPAVDVLVYELSPAGLYYDFHDFLENVIDIVLLSRNFIILPEGRKKDDFSHQNGFRETIAIIQSCLISVDNCQWQNQVDYAWGGHCAVVRSRSNLKVDARRGKRRYDNRSTTESPSRRAARTRFSVFQVSFHRASSRVCVVHIILVYVWAQECACIGIRRAVLWCVSRPVEALKTNRNTFIRNQSGRRFQAVRIVCRADPARCSISANDIHTPSLSDIA